MNQSDEHITESKLQFQENSDCKKLLKEISSLKNQLAKSKKDYQDFYDYNTSFYFTIDHNYMIYALNFQAAHFLGSDRKNIINTSFIVHLTANSHVLFKNNILNLFKTKLKQTCHIEFLPKGNTKSNGSTHLSSSTSRDVDRGRAVTKKKHVILESTLLENNLIRICILDITEKEQNINRIFELEKSFGLINNLFQNSSEAISALDNQLNILAMNQLFVDFFSKFFTTKIHVGSNLISNVTSFPKIKIEIIAACQTAINGNQSSVIIENRNNLNETYFCYELKVKSLYNEYSKRNELIVLINNITEQKLQSIKQLKQQYDLRMSSKARIMTEMASALGHEINQPLTVITTYSSSCLFLLKNSHNYEDICRKLIDPLEKIASQAEHAGKLIHSMKKFMKEEQFILEKTDINMLINESISILDYESISNLLITLNLNNTLPKIMVNRIHIIQVILNLLRNSIEALQSIEHDCPEIVIETSDTVDQIIVHVRDNGPGIPENYRNQILNTYFTTKPNGSGLGLGICHTLIQEHGGQLEVLQPEGSGACFAFILPKNCNT